MTWQIIRSIQTFQIGAADSDYQIIRAASGPRGQPAGQDLGWGPLSGGFTSGEIIDGPPLPRAATFATLRLWSRTGVSAPAVIGIQLNGVQVATVTMAVASLPTKQTFALTPIACGVDDVVSLVMPNPADSQLQDLTASLGSTP